MNQIWQNCQTVSFLTSFVDCCTQYVFIQMLKAPKASWKVRCEWHGTNPFMYNVKKMIEHTLKILWCTHWDQSLHKKSSFSMRISSVNVTKSTVSHGFGHIYWRNYWWKTSFFALWILFISHKKYTVIHPRHRSVKCC